MKSTLFLRIAAVLTFIHAVLHTIGGVFGKPDPGPSQTAFTAMQANHFPVMGLTRSYADFYMGLGLALTISMTMEAIVFWLLASLAKTDGARLRPILAVFMAGYLFIAVNSFAYFFYAPVIVEILIALCLGMAIFTAESAGKSEASSA
jgi:hypothetical protein